MNADNGKHTFVILAYKESPYLEECIKSVYRQTAPSRVIMVTATPNKHIEDLATKYQTELLVNPNGGTIGKDWNFGLAAAHTPYVTLAHQDDVYFPRFTERCLAAVRKYAGDKPVLLFTRSVIEKDGKVLRFPLKNLIRQILIFPFHFKRCIRLRIIKKSILLFSNSISCPGVMYGKGNHQPALVFDEQLKYVLDWNAWYQMSLMDGAFVYIPEQLHLHREHDQSATNVAGLAVLQHEEQHLLTELWGSRLIAKIITGILLIIK